jgi:hypothetical protein
MATVIYFIEAIGAGLVKIGYTENDPEVRLRQLQTGCPFPMRVLGSISGEPEDEAEIHQKFAGYRRHGEWFEMSAEIVAYALVTNVRETVETNEDILWNLSSYVHHIKDDFEKRIKALEGSVAQPVAAGGDCRM